MFALMFKYSISSIKLRNQVSSNNRKQTRTDNINAIRAIVDRTDRGEDVLTHPPSCFEINTTNRTNCRIVNILSFLSEKLVLAFDMCCK